LIAIRSIDLYIVDCRSQRKKKKKLYILRDTGRHRLMWMLPRRCCYYKYSEYIIIMTKRTAKQSTRYAGRSPYFVDSKRRTNNDADLDDDVDDSNMCIASSTRSPYFDESKRQKNNDDDYDDLDDIDDSIYWTSTKELPPHLMGNKYFDDEKNVTILHRQDIPHGFSLSQTICSYGYFCLAPNRWIPSERDDEGYLVRPLSVRYHGEEDIQKKKEHNCSKTTLVAIGQNTKTRSVIVAVKSSPSSTDSIYRKKLTKQIDRMLRLDTSLDEFHKLHDEAKKRGFGRLYRSPTLFEDMIKTITNCNMKWSGTVEMNAKLCRHVGRDGAFPTPDQINEVGSDFLKENCRVGYRDKYIWGLANDIVEGRIDLQELESVANTRVDVEKRLLKIKGVGPFASNNILQLMGYFNVHPYDTETVRLWKDEFGAPNSATKTEVFKKAKSHYAQYDEKYSFIAYWFDLWKNYENRAGSKSPQWSIEQLESERPSGVESDHNSVFFNMNATKGVSQTRKKKHILVESGEKTISSLRRKKKHPVPTVTP
jgi:3-methyladenine DNA glycosylase/8-oxoguanine DNA glycosylase